MDRTIQTWCRQLIALATLLVSSAAAAESGMTFKYVQETIYASGQIEAESADRLRTFVADNHISGKATVALSSAGGSLAGGVRLGKLIRELGFDTNVYRYTGPAKTKGDGSIDDALALLDEDQPADCSSACVYAYAGGVHRYLYSGSRLGIHQFYFQDDAKATAQDAQLLSALIVAHLSAMGAKPELFSAASLFKKDQIRYLSTQEADEFGLVNHGILRLKFSYGVSLGRPYPQFSYETPDGKFVLALLCNGKTLHIGASREQVRRNALSSRDEVYYLFLNDVPYYQMGRDADSFHHEVDGAFLTSLFASRLVQTWAEKPDLNLDGGQFRVDSWEPFIDYAKDCK